MEKIVYVVKTEQPYPDADDLSNIYIFSTKEKAQQFINKIKKNKCTHYYEYIDSEINEYELDCGYSVEI